MSNLNQPFGNPETGAAHAVLPDAQPYASLVYTEDSQTPVPITHAHRIILWNAAEHLDQPFNYSAITYRSMQSLRRNGEHISSPRILNAAKSALRDFLQDGILIRDTARSTYFPNMSQDRKEPLLGISGLGLYVAAESARRTLETSTHYLQVDKAAKLRSDITKFLLTHRVAPTTGESIWKQQHRK